MLKDYRGRFVCVKDKCIYPCQSVEPASRFSTLEQIHHVMTEHHLKPSHYHICQYFFEAIGEHPADVMLAEQADSLKEIIHSIHKGLPVSYENLKRVLVIKQENSHRILGSIYYDERQEDILLGKNEEHLWTSSL